VTQPQAQQKQRLGKYPAFHAFLDFLDSIPESQHVQAWQEMYGLLLKDDRADSDDWDRAGGGW
jgi:poly-beta-hydroxyalkanoate depolymerase